MQENKKNIDEISEMLNKLIEKFPEVRREVHEKIGEMIKSEVDMAISSSNFADGGDLLKQYQRVYVASGGGYAAVRAINTTSGKNSPGAITNYNENGHKIRGQGSGRNYRPRVKVPVVQGRRFYEQAKNNSAVNAYEIAKEIIDKYVEDIS